MPFKLLRLGEHLSEHLSVFALLQYFTFIDLMLPSFGNETKGFSVLGFSIVFPSPLNLSSLLVLPAFIHSFVPSFIPYFLPFCMPSFLPYFLPCSFPPCRPSSLPFLMSFLYSCLCSFIQSFLPSMPLVLFPSLAVHSLSCQLRITGFLTNAIVNSTDYNLLNINTVVTLNCFINMHITIVITLS